ncbi:uncharacterized protein LOC105423069 [Pogonomyrmex barbatus]|uniref:Odorant receptor n=1 Tax=Pogonomyrmex barbatus TaxID=144034 RepID=A0A8N1S2T1_9HYME|nr:uncharacterized protein LOC105423069 [Pogonomyrmex barbatus]
MNMESKSGILIQFIMLYLAVTMEAFIFCFAGEYLSTKSKSIGDAVYEMVWYNLSTSECRILLFVILRSQKQLTTAGKVMDLTLESFTTSKSIGDAAYETLWYDLSTNECRILLLIIVRSQKRLTITAGKVMDLTLEGFTTVLHVSGQIDIICQEMKNISKNILYGSSKFSFGMLIERHNRVISFSQNIEKLFSFIALMQVIWNTLVICSLGLVIIIVLHVSGQIDILCQELLTICGDGTLQDNLIVASVRFLIIKHQKIITLSENIEELYSDIALMQILSNTVVICCIGFTIIGSLTKEGATVMMLKSAIFYVAITLEAFIFCFAGEYLSAKSKSIGDAVYGTLWYDMTPAECRILLFVILRSQKRLTITAGNVMDLSLEGFTSVMKASASYMSVLHAMY